MEDELRERMVDSLMREEVGVPSEEALYARLAMRLNAAMMRACLTRAQMEIVGDELLRAATELADDVDRFACAQHELLEEEEVPVEEPEPEVVIYVFKCTACQRDMGPSRMMRPLAEHMQKTFKCPGCLREGR